MVYDESEKENVLNQSFRNLLGEIDVYSQQSSLEHSKNVHSPKNLFQSGKLNGIENPSSLTFKRRPEIPFDQPHLHFLQLPPTKLHLKESRKSKEGQVFYKNSRDNQSRVNKIKSHIHKSDTQSPIKTKDDNSYSFGLPNQNLHRLFLPNLDSHVSYAKNDYALYFNKNLLANHNSQILLDRNIKDGVLYKSNPVHFNSNSNNEFHRENRFNLNEYKINTNYKAQNEFPAANKYKMNMNKIQKETNKDIIAVNGYKLNTTIDRDTKRDKEQIEQHANTYQKNSPVKIYKNKRKKKNGQRKDIIALNTNKYKDSKITRLRTAQLEQHLNVNPSTNYNSNLNLYEGTRRRKIKEIEPHSYINGPQRYNLKPQIYKEPPKFKSHTEVHPNRGASKKNDSSEVIYQSTEKRKMKQYKNIITSNNYNLKNKLYEEEERRDNNQVEQHDDISSSNDFDLNAYTYKDAKKEDEKSHLTVGASNKYNLRDVKAEIYRETKTNQDEIKQHDSNDARIFHYTKRMENANQKNVSKGINEWMINYVNNLSNTLLNTFRNSEEELEQQGDINNSNEYISEAKIDSKIQSIFRANKNGSPNYLKNTTFQDDLASKINRHQLSAGFKPIFNFESHHEKKIVPQINTNVPQQNVSSSTNEWMINYFNSLSNALLDTFRNSNSPLNSNFINFPFVLLPITSFLELQQKGVIEEDVQGFGAFILPKKSQ